MKLYHNIAVFFIAVMLLTACQKDMVLNADGISVGTFKSTGSGDCSVLAINGIYKVDSVLNNNFYVDVEVDVTVAGSFEIKSDTVNGFSFKKSGTISTGLNIIRLYASGKPVTTGMHRFTIKYGITTCSFSITVFGSGGGFGTALYTLGGAPGNCSLSSLNGNYIVGIGMTPANKVEMVVNVSTVGTYNISSTASNGISFIASGAFINPGIQNVFLSASGTPTAPGLYNYSVTNGATTCSFSVNCNTVVTNATYTLSGSPGNCTAAAVNGVYTAGTTLDATNTVVVYVNVTSPGIYSIATTTVNGIVFSASGTFNLTGLQQVTLKGTGTPVAAGTFSYPLTGGGNTCQFSVTSL